jgi:hypothetical protein
MNFKKFLFAFLLIATFWMSSGMFNMKKINIFLIHNGVVFISDALLCFRCNKFFEKKTTTTTTTPQPPVMTTMEPNCNCKCPNMTTPYNGTVGAEQH